MKIFRQQCTKSNGFTLVELALILVIIGILTGIGLPIAKTFIEQYKSTQDRNSIAQLKKLLIGYTLTRGGLPDDTGNVIPANNMGMTGINAYNKNIQYFANALLTEAATAQNLTTLCDTARNIVDGTTVSTTPAICNNVTDNFVNCTDSTVMLFVIISSGKNQSLDHENADADQIFENPSKRPNSLNDYDDIIESYGLPELVNECQSA